MLTEIEKDNRVSSSGHGAGTTVTQAIERSADISRRLLGGS
jgi:hypothetical protein